MSTYTLGDTTLDFLFSHATNKQFCQQVNSRSGSLLRAVLFRALG